MSQPRIAIIGTGIAGLGCAHPPYDLTLFKQQRYAGGHTNTVDVHEDGRDLPVDTGFMVFNHVWSLAFSRQFQERSEGGPVRFSLSSCL